MGRPSVIKAVLWDFGGVLTTSPFEAFNRFERRHNLPENFLRRVNATNPDNNAWARFERSEITLQEFDRQFEEETRRAGYPVQGMSVLPLLSGELRPQMVEALRRCSLHFRTACLTNNVRTEKDAKTPQSGGGNRAVQEVMALFDLVLESSKVGLRKPDPRFYEMACTLLEITPGDAVYLDDLGINLKPARAMGMATIKVTEPGAALRQLEDLVGLELT